MPTLLVHRGGTEERRLELGHQVLRIGRGVGNDLILDSEGKSVSRCHAELRYENGQYVILDLNSQNGVWIEGRRIQRETLKEGVAAVIGPYRLVVEVHGPTAGTDATAGASEAKEPAQLGETVVVAPARGTKTAPTGRSGPSLRLPRTVLLGGVAGVCVLIAITALVVSRTHARTDVPSGSTVAPTPGPETDEPLRVAAAPPPVPVVAPAPAAADTPNPPDPAKPSAPAVGVTAPPAVADPVQLVHRAKGETPGAARARARRLQSEYADASTALGRGDYAGAQRVLEQILRDEPQFLDSAALLEKAKDGQRQMDRESAAREATLAMSEAKRLEASGDLRGALDAYQRAQGLNGGADGVAAAVAGLRDKMRAAGEDIFAQAKQYDAQGRVSDALTLYQQVVQLLSADQPHRAVAQARISVLKGSIK